GGHYIRESIIRYTEATYISAGTGAETRSERQVELIKRFGATVLVGFSDYLLRLAEVVREQGLDPVKDLNVRMIIGHLPEGGRKKLEDAWGGVPAFNWYGVADTGILSTEGPERDGLYIWEDANFVEVLDSETHAPTPRGETGELVVTSLAKSDLAPLIRFNTHDLTALLPGHGSANMPFDRMAGLLGRSDNMVKLRGINVYPTALSAILVNIPGFSGEYFARLEKAPSGSDHLVVVVEVREQSESIRLQIEDHLSATLGLKIGAEIVGVGETAEITQLTTRQKPIRLVDARA
ncbi:MAG: phenylacetate--CoA ligase family protein, partial [Actinobacteria bacterium]|nr:phenylacetate--CoA ligase family protein [Actinomycetota bacterium]